MRRIRERRAVLRAMATSAVVAGATALCAGTALAADPYLGEATPTVSDSEPVVIAAPVVATTAFPEIVIAARPEETSRTRPTPVTPVTPVAPLAPLAPLAQLAPLLRLSTNAWYGVSLRCEDCSISRARHDGDETMEWRFRSEPEIVDVEPDSPADKAGVQPGDVLTHVDGHDITSRQGGRRFGAVQPGEKVRWTVRDGRTSRVVNLVAEERPDRESRSLQSVGDELRAAAEALRDQHDQLRDSHLDAARLRELQQAEEKVAKMAQKLAELDRNRSLLAPRALVLDPDEVMILPDDDPSKDPVRIVKRDRTVHRLRYTGEIGDSRVEVRGTSEVVVTEEKDGDLVIDTPEASIRVEKKKR